MWCLTWLQEIAKLYLARMNHELPEPKDLIKAVRILTLGLVVLIVSCLFTCFSIAINKLYGLCMLLQFLICSLTWITTEVFIFLSLDCVCVWQGEEGPPSLEYIKAKDLFPQKELVKEDESLQVRWQPLLQHGPICSHAQQHDLILENREQVWHF